MVQTVQLDENKHAVTMLRGLKQSQHEREHCDFIIKVQGQEYHAHKIILSLGSPYFKAMLKHDTKEIQEGTVEMQDVDFECGKACIDFMYTASFDIPDGKIGDLLHVAIMMQLEDVKDAISGILKNSLRVANFYETRNIADVYNLQVISEECRKYYDTNFMEISHQPGFKNEKKTHLIKKLKSKKLSEEQKLAVSLRWMGENTERKSVIFELIKLIDLNRVDLQYLGDLLENHPVVSNDLRLYKLLNTPLVESAKKETFDTRSNIEKTQDEGSSDKEQIVLFDSETDNLQSYNPITNEVTVFRKKNFNHLQPFNVFSMDTYIYRLCDDRSVHRLDFRHKNSTWERMQDMIVCHGHHPPCVSLLGSIFVVGGSCEITTEAIEKFDSNANRWLRLKDRTTAISGAAVVGVEDTIYCIGGENRFFNSTNSFCQCSLLNSEWISLERMRIARTECAAVVVNQRIFVMGGGEYGNGALNEMECYDITSGHWTTLTPMFKRRMFFNAHHVNGNWIFVLHEKEVEKYNIARNVWQRVKVRTSEPFQSFHCYKSISLMISKQNWNLLYG